jgi:hypothetical protein
MLMENVPEIKKKGLVTKILFGIIIVSTLITVYLTVKLIYLGFTFR